MSNRSTQSDFPVNEVSFNLSPLGEFPVRLDTWEEAAGQVYEAAHNLQLTFTTVNLALLLDTLPGVTTFSWEKP